VSFTTNQRAGTRCQALDTLQTALDLFIPRVYSALRCRVSHNLASHKCILRQRMIRGPVKHLNLRSGAVPNIYNIIEKASLLSEWNTYIDTLRVIGTKEDIKCLFPPSVILKHTFTQRRAVLCGWSARVSSPLRSHYRQTRTNLYVIFVFYGGKLSRSRTMKSRRAFIHAHG